MAIRKYRFDDDDNYQQLGALPAASGSAKKYVFPGDEEEEDGQAVDPPKYDFR